MKREADKVWLSPSVQASDHEPSMREIKLRNDLKSKNKAKLAPNPKNFKFSNLKKFGNPAWNNCPNGAQVVLQTKNSFFFKNKVANKIKDESNYSTSCEQKDVGATPNDEDRGSYLLDHAKDPHTSCKESSPSKKNADHMLE